jgi:hypothetical protein
MSKMKNNALKKLVFSSIICLSINSFATKTTATPSGHFKKVVWIVLENTNYQGAMKQPYLAELLKSGATLTNMFGEAHPSQGNYIAMISGSTLGVKNDKPVDLSDSHIGDLLEKAGKDWRVYAEDFPGNCFTGITSQSYARKHVPFISFTNVSKDSARCKKIEAADRFSQDLSAGLTPEYSMYIPNLKNDGHNTGVDFAGKWLSSTFGSLFKDPSTLGDTLFVITFDESEGSNTNQIYTLLIGSKINPGSSTAQLLNHTSLLKMIEDELGLGNLGRDDAKAPVITGIWK